MEIKYSKEQFEGYTHRFIVKMKVDNDWRNDTNVTIYSNSDNYSIGGGLSDNGAFASRRHEEAKEDSGKLTLGKTVQLFKKATGLEIELINSIINFKFDNLEWHHAGKLPKSYGGGMKKTYFVNSKQIVELAENLDKIVSDFEKDKEEKLKQAIDRKNKEIEKQNFLKENAIYHSRIKSSEIPEFFYEKECEMNGKFGWFSAYGQSYNLPKYYSGYSFKTQKELDKYFQL